MLPTLDRRPTATHRRPEPLTDDATAHVMRLVGKLRAELRAAGRL